MSTAAINVEALSPAARKCYDKMSAAGVSAACIATFLKQHAVVSGGGSGLIRESDIRPVPPLDRLEDILSHSGGGGDSAEKEAAKRALLGQTVMLKLNGGLGTGMGLSEAKSLLTVKDGKTFLDFTALQVRHLRERSRSGNGNGEESRALKFMLLNSFSTVDGTRAYLTEHYPTELGGAAFDAEVSLLQNQVPKIDAATLEPVSWPANPKEEWCPPGHGDLYTALYGSGKLEELLSQGYRYLFVSNGDNLGATLDADILYYMAHTKKAAFLMEVCERTESDRKGGHLALRVNNSNNNNSGVKEEGGTLVLRESAQCAAEDEAAFQDISKYSYFNTNNLWVSLPALLDVMRAHGGTLPLPVIRNEKTVDPTDKNSTKVFQLETAMGAAIELFGASRDNNNNTSQTPASGSAALVVPRTRFAPVKTNADLLSLRSDCYTVTPDYRLVLDPHSASGGRRPPTISLDTKYYKFLSGFEGLLLGGSGEGDKGKGKTAAAEEVAAHVPSLKHCTSLTVKGKVQFGKGVVVEGDVTIQNDKEDEVLKIADGTKLSNTTVKQ